MRALLIAVVVFCATAGFAEPPFTPFPSPLGTTSSLGGGASIAVLDLSYVRLDSTNMPITGTVTVNGTSNLVGGAVVGTDVGAAALTTYVQLPRMIGATIGAKPTCSAVANAGMEIYVDDTDDLIAGAVCGCGATSVGVYSWTLLNTATVCP